VTTPAPAHATVRVVPGEVDARSATTRLAIPTSVQPVWAPFERVGETLASRSRQFSPHSHESQEVLTYVVEGFATYQLENQPLEPIQAGSVRLLIAPERATHRISPARGSPIRWFNLVVGLPPSHGGPRVERLESPAVTSLADGVRSLGLVGGASGLRSQSGLEATVYLFDEPSTIFQRVGHERRAVAYALSGRGTLDDQNLDGGEAALVEGAAGVAVRGAPGFRVIVSSVPIRAGPPGAVATPNVPTRVAAGDGPAGAPRSS
jgi:redox-sensitive bicupin YhaK (pirin superfamily)